MGSVSECVKYQGECGSLLERSEVETGVEGVKQKHNIYTAISFSIIRMLFICCWALGFLFFFSGITVWFRSIYSLDFCFFFLFLYSFFSDTQRVREFGIIVIIIRRV